MNKEILRLAIPNILSNISIPLLSTVDTVLMGTLSPRHLGAVGIGSMIFNFIYWNFGFLRMGTTGMTAQAFGAKDATEQIHNFIRAATIAILLAIIMLFLMVPFERLSILAFNVEGDQAQLVREYFYVRIWAAPATLLIYVISGWFFGMQNAIFPLIITIAVNIINIVASIFLVKYQGLEMKGVAMGTVIAQYLGVIMALILFLWKYGHLRKLIDKGWKKKEAFQRFLQVNRDIFIRTIFLTLAFGFFYSKSSEAGETILATNVILLQFLNWMSFGIDGFGYAAESLVGKYFGAKENENTRLAIKTSFIWGLVLAIGFSICYIFFFLDIIQLFSEDTEVIQASLEFKWWMVLFPIIAFICYIWDGVYIGLTASKSMRNTMLLSFIVYLVSYYALLDTAPNKAIWMAMMIFLFARGLIQTVWYSKYGLEMK